MTSAILLDDKWIELRPSRQTAQPKFTLEFMMMVARQVVEKELGYRDAAKLYGVSHGSIGAWVKKYKKKSQFT